MTQVDFYVLDENTEHQVENVACRLAEKAMQGGSRIYLCCQNDEQTKLLDKLLWEFRESSFLPHATDESDSEAPIGLGTARAPDHFHDILINLSGQIPEGYARFERILELVPADHQSREASRNNFSHYRDRGYPLKKHDIR
jgi:DNA polymerase-3 subunit chi